MLIYLLLAHTDAVKINAVHVMLRRKSCTTNKHSGSFIGVRSKFSSDLAARSRRVQLLVSRDTFR
jgi:hypothetical protein